MISRLSGKLVEKQAPHLIIDTHGVGYDLLAPMTTFYRLPELGLPVTLHTHLAISETSHQLYGFISREDRDLFRLLIKVNGVGPKMAVGVMSMESADLVQCVRSDNVAALVKVPGVGKKTAERLVVDMRDKLKGWGLPGPGAAGGDVVKVASLVPNRNSFVAEAESALIALGYKPTEAAKAVSSAFNDEITRSEDLIRLALKSMLPA